MSAEKLSSPILAVSAPTTLAKQLLESWKDPEYRAEFVGERVKSSVALQIRALREQRNGMTQKELGDALGKAQTWISVLEDPEYGKMSVATLLSLAQAFDTDLEIRFRPFSRALHELTKQDSSYFEVRSFSEELPDLENSSSLGWFVPSGEWGDTLRAARLLGAASLRMNDVPSASGAISPAMQPRVQTVPDHPIAASLMATTKTLHIVKKDLSFVGRAKKPRGARHPRRTGRFGKRNQFTRKQIA